MHSHVAPYPAQIWFGQAYLIQIFNNQNYSPIFFPLTVVVTLLLGGIPAFSGSTLRDVEENSLNVSPLLPAFSDQPHLKVGVVGLGLQSNLSIYKHFVHLFLWDAVFAHFAKGAEARIALWRENVDS